MCARQNFGGGGCSLGSPLFGVWRVTEYSTLFKKGDAKLVKIDFFQLFLPVFYPFLFVFVLFLLFLAVYIILDKRSFEKSPYKKVSGISYFKMRLNQGYYGEYLIFSMLERIKGEKHILTNVYIPKGTDDDKTTEIDVIMLHETGLYVIESKNYSGWIFGKEEDRYWMQTLNQRSKNKFYNPIKQNEMHLKYLFKILEEKGLPIRRYFSLIVFSVRCELKNVSYTSEHVRVIKRNRLKNMIEKLTRESGPVYSSAELQQIFDLLKPFSNVSEELKVKHIADIKERKGAGI
ncbi:hypothetical protein CULT_370018 [[Clostridium] ultunense Esp]|nr:hypothetical protein CULT_370018 [[Clostridium] ultunense Esp]